MLKGQKKHTDKEQGKTKDEALRSGNYRAKQNKNNIGTTALERPVVYITGEFKGISNYITPEGFILCISVAIYLSSNTADALTSIFGRVCVSCCEKVKA